MTAESLEEKVQRLEALVLDMQKTVEQNKKDAQRALDVQAVQNVMSKHSIYDAAGMNREQLRDIWAQKAPDVSFGQNHGLYVGMDTITEYYCDLWEQKLRPEQFERMKKLFPQIEDKKENDLSGWMKMHTNTTPIIEIAGDGKTAKGWWESPGFITECIEESYTISAIWMWERFAVDFIKEDGEWKIWHFNAFIHMFTPYEKSWVSSTIEPRVPPEKPRGELYPPNVPIVRHESWSPTRVQKFFPRPPEPYETFSETFTYGPE